MLELSVMGIEAATFWCESPKAEIPRFEAAWRNIVLHLNRVEPEGFEQLQNHLQCLLIT
jgi:hypothetical protein